MVFEVPIFILFLFLLLLVVFCVFVVLMGGGGFWSLVFFGRFLFCFLCVVEILFQ